MGLFIGFSFISIFEMFYFGTIRWITDLWIRNKFIKNHGDIDNNDGYKVNRNGTVSISNFGNNASTFDLNLPFNL